MIVDKRPTREIRAIPLEIEVRTSESGSKTLVGYAAKFGVLSERMWGFREKIAPGAFRSTLQEGRSIKALWNHDSNLPIGSTDSGTLILSEDDIGLRFELNPIDTTAGRDALTSVDSGVVRGVSFGFITKTDAWDWTDDANPIRTLEDVELIEISPTPFPAYPQTDVQARSMEDVFESAKALNSNPAGTDTAALLEHRRRKMKHKF